MIRFQYSIVRSARLAFALTFTLAVGMGGQAMGQAQMGTAFTYQGQLKQAGEPVNDVCDFRFSLWDDGGVQIGTTQIVNDVSVDGGLFTSLLDFHSGVFDGDLRLLEIAVSCPAGSGDFTTLSPRQELTPAPYSLFSDAADYSASTRGITVDDQGRVGIGTDPVQALTVRAPTGRGDVGITQNQVGGPNTMELTTEDSAGSLATRLLLRGGADEGDIEFYRGARGAEELIMVIDGPTGHVGIGTTASPTARLQIGGTPGIDGIKFPDGSTQFSAATGNKLDDAYNEGGAGAGRIITANAGPVEIAGSDGLIVAGEVGIGMAAPPQRLSLFDGNLALKVADNADEQSILFQNAGNAYTWRIYRTDAGTEHEDHATLRFAGGLNQTFTELDDVLTLNDEGRVGIGTTNPEDQLHLKSNNANTILIESTADPADAFAGVLTRTNVQSGGSREWFFGSTSGIGDGEWQLTDNTARLRRITVNDDGKVAIGPFPPDSNTVARLQVQGGLSVEGNTGVSGNLELDGDFVVNDDEGSHMPIQFKFFGPVDTGGDNVDFSTGFRTDLYNVFVGSFGAFNGDINEDDSGDIIKCYTYRKESGFWWCRADFRTHGNQEEWRIGIVAVSTSMSNLRNDRWFPCGANCN